MLIIETDKDHSQLLLSEMELGLIIKVLKYSLKELEFEYETRTGFYEHETLELIDRVERFEKKTSESINIPVGNKDIYDIRQNFVEGLFAIR
jgi:hypothetical protein